MNGFPYIRNEYGILKMNGESINKVWRDPLERVMNKENPGEELSQTKAYRRKRLQRHLGK